MPENLFQCQTLFEVFYCFKNFPLSSCFQLYISIFDHWSFWFFKHALVKSLAFFRFELFKYGLEDHVFSFVWRQYRVQLARLGGNPRDFFLSLILASMASTVLLHMSYIKNGQRSLGTTLNWRHHNSKFHERPYSFFNWRPCAEFAFVSSYRLVSFSVKSYNLPRLFTGYSNINSKYSQANVYLWLWLEWSGWKFWISLNRPLFLFQRDKLLDVLDLNCIFAAEIIFSSFSKRVIVSSYLDQMNMLSSMKAVRGRVRYPLQSSAGLASPEAAFRISSIAWRKSIGDMTHPILIQTLRNKLKLPLRLNARDWNRSGKIWKPSIVPCSKAESAWGKKQA